MTPLLFLTLLSGSAAAGETTAGRGGWLPVESKAQERKRRKREQEARELEQTIRATIRHAYRTINGLEHEVEEITEAPVSQVPMRATAVISALYEIDTTRARNVVAQLETKLAKLERYHDELIALQEQDDDDAETLSVLALAA